jgi:formylglycine-generating enzyme required for sulfatase activity
MVILSIFVVLVIQSIKPPEKIPVVVTVTQVDVSLPTARLPGTPVPQVTLSSLSLPSQIIDDYGVPMVLVPAGSFRMGSDADIVLVECSKLGEPFSKHSCERSWFDDTEPIHTVILGDYYIDYFEVTNAEFAELLNSRGNQEEDGEAWLDADDRDVHIVQISGKWRSKSGYENHPVGEVTWYGARAYCEWRGARLPTEAEWEKAARGGLDGKIYTWGDDFGGNQANFCDINCERDDSNSDFNDGYKGTAPVGSYEPNGYGLFDMAGNVFEWVFDWYDVYPGGDVGSSDYFGHIWRVARGGSYYDLGYNLHIAKRVGIPPSGITGANLGFRCARNASP